MKTPFQANCKLHDTPCILMSLHMESDSCDHPGVGIPYFHRKKHLEELYILCLAVKETFYWHFLVTTFVNLVTKKIISVASSKCLPKKVQCGPWIDHPSSFIEDITWWREDMNFMFEGQEQYLTSERRERVGYCSCHKNIKFISSSWRVMFFLLYKHTADGVFDDFLKSSKDFPKLSRRPDKPSRTFSENFRKFLKMSEDCRRLSRKTQRCFDDTPTNLSTI